MGLSDMAKKSINPFVVLQHENLISVFCVCMYFMYMYCTLYGYWYTWFTFHLTEINNFIHLAKLKLISGNVLL